MARTFSQSMVQAVTRIEGEVPVLLASIAHPGLATPVRIANVDNTVTSRGNLYVGLPFRIALPSFERGTPPRARMAVDNIGRELVQWLEISRGGAGAKVTLELVMFDTPDVVEWAATLSLRNIAIDSFEVGGDLGYEDLVNSLFVRRKFTPQWAPGLY